MLSLCWEGPFDITMIHERGLLCACLNSCVAASSRRRHSIDGRQGVWRGKLSIAGGTSGSGSWEKRNQEVTSQIFSEDSEAADFSFKDGKRLCLLFLKQQALVKKKRKWLASINPKPGVPIRSLKRPKFLKDVYLAESIVRSDQLSSERVRSSIEKSFGLQSICYNHHVVQDGLVLFELRKQSDGSLCPESLNIMHCTISKLRNEALNSVANIVTHNRTSFREIRPTMKKIVMDHLPTYLAELDSENSKSLLSKILTNPCSYQSDSIILSTPVSPMLLSSINQALDWVDEMPEHAVVAMNRKLRGKSCPPKFLHIARTARRSHLVHLIRKRCRSMIKKLQEGQDLPKMLAKALSVLNLYRKLTLRSMDISQSEFFPFPHGTMSLQNDILNALWSLPKVNIKDMKFLYSRLGKSSNAQTFKAPVRRYLTECLFECGDVNLPDEALRAIAFLVRMSPKRQQVILTEDRKELEVEAVLNVSSCLRSLTRRGTAECPSDDEVSLESDMCSKDNDFVFTETKYFNFRSQQQTGEGCCSNVMTNSAEDSECSGGVGHYGDSEAARSTMEASSKDRMNMTRCSEVDISVVCDKTASVAHKLIGQILKNMLHEEKGVDELTRHYLGGSSIFQGPRVSAARKNQKADIVMNAVKDLLPNLPKRSMDKVKRILDVDEQ